MLFDFFKFVCAIPTWACDIDSLDTFFFSKKMFDLKQLKHASPSPLLLLHPSSRQSAKTKKQKTFNIKHSRTAVGGGKWEGRERWCEGQSESNLSEWKTRTILLGLRNPTVSCGAFGHFVGPS